MCKSVIFDKNNPQKCVNEGYVCSFFNLNKNLDLNLSSTRNVVTNIITYYCCCCVKPGKDSCLNNNWVYVSFVTDLLQMKWPYVEEKGKLSCMEAAYHRGGEYMCTF